MKPIDNSQIPCGESVKLLTFLGHFLATLVIIWSKCFNTKKDPFKMELKYISSRKRPFCWFIHSLCKNQSEHSYAGKPLAAYRKKMPPNHRFKLQLLRIFH